MLTIFSKNNCPQCDKAKAHLKSKNIEFTEVKIDQDMDKRNWLVAQGHKSVPQVYDGDVCIGGAKEVIAKFQ